MEMTRRGFLSALGLGAAGMALDPERLLWRPGAKKIFVPKPAPPLTGRDVFGIAASSISAGNYGYVQVFGAYREISRPSDEFILEVPVPESTLLEMPDKRVYRLIKASKQYHQGDIVFS